MLRRHINKERYEVLEFNDPVNVTGPAFVGVDGNGQNVNYNYIKAYDYFDLSGRVSVVENLSLTLTVQNIGNRKPPAVGSTIGSTAYNSGNTYRSTCEARGRRYAVSAHVKF